MLLTSPAGVSAPSLRADRWLPLAAAGLTFAVYLVTIYPGLFGMGDAAKFAFVGKVLGTPHAPGYPLYVMVSHLFSYVPIGTLAYRMNVLSAILAATAVALLYFGCRILDARPVVAFATALAFGFGRAFWSKAQYPKGYSMNAALVCAGVLLLLQWGRTRRPSRLYGAIAVFALASGNHLIIISLVPALVLYALTVDARRALAPRTVVIAAVLIALGLSQYSYIIIRTRQQAPYLEAKASNIRQLIPVMTARRYANEIGAFSSREVVERRVPGVARIVRDELTTAGLVLAAGGVIALCWRRRWKDAMLCALGALGVATLTANMGSNEDEGFLLPAFAMLWLLVAAGAESAARGLARLFVAPGYRERRVVTAAILVLVLLLPAEQLVANYRRNDHSRRTFEIRYYSALFDALPDRSAIVLDQYNINMMVFYKLLGEGAARGREIVTVPQSHDEVAALRRRGFQIYAFGEGRRALSDYGYQFEPVELFDLPLPQYLDEVPDRWTIAIAATPAASQGLRDNRRGWRRIGADDARVFGEGRFAYALIGSNGIGRDKAGAGEVVVSVDAGTRLASDGPLMTAAVTATATEGEAWITIAGAERVRARNGAVVAIIDPAGRVDAYPLDPRFKLRVPFNPAVQGLFRVTRAEVCRDIGNAGWKDFSDVVNEGRLSVVINNYRPFLARTVFYMSGEVPARPILKEVSGKGEPQLSLKTYAMAVPADRDAFHTAAAADGLDATAALATSAVVSRVELAVNDDGDQKSVAIAFGFIPARAFVRATVDLDNPKRATVCGAERAPGW
jgi:hypothetical protein